ncbi:PIG-L deacetylase family protein [Paenibacillus sp. MBLB4367]|uniref:PIG-L deacetylase family protein n=1 Tax=Paenibacillus sp. MBLB4367 TaxID=3384767 RepID=UPI0039083CEC
MKKRLLFVFAHPDDESFASAGTIAKYCSRGHEAFLICATSGCKGKSGEFEITCRERLALHREQELRNACDLMGITELYLYRYADGSLIEQDRDKMAERIKKTILEVKPHVVVTFPPDGVTGHPDHIAVSRATEQAVLLSEKLLSGSDLPAFYYVSIPHYYEHCQDSGPEERYPITGKVSIGNFRLRKGEALKAHKSQVYSLNRAYPGVIRGDCHVIGDYEYYTLVRVEGKPVHPIVPPGEIPEIDLI